MSDHDCIFTDEERHNEIRKVLREEIRQELDNYFLHAPWRVQAEQHYQDHMFIESMKGNLDTFRDGFISKLGTLLVIILAAGSIGGGIVFILRHISK